MNKKFVIFITSYNYAEYIGQAIESVINQTDPNWNLYIIDDCSTDNTYEVVQKYLEKDNRISWKKHDKNIGSVPTIIEGFSEIDADYISTLCSDDWLEPNFVADAKKAFDEHPEIPFCALGWSLANQNENIFQKYAIPFPERFSKKIYLSPYLVFGNFININFLVFNKKCINNFLCGLKEYKIKQELEAFLIKYLEETFGAGYINNDDHGHWRWHEKQISQKNDNSHQSFIELLVEPLIYCSQSNLTKLPNLSNRFMCLVRILGRAGIPYRAATEWILSDLGKPFAEKFGNLDFEFIKANNLEKSLLCLAICVWNAFIVNQNHGGWESNVNVAKQQLNQWITDLQNKYQLRSIKAIYKEANKLYDGYFMPLIK